MVLVPLDPEDLAIGSIIYSHKGRRPFAVSGFCKYALDCSITMVTFVNLKPTDDSPAGTAWVLDESTLIKMFLRQE